MFVTISFVADRYIFADEAGNFDFSRGSGASRYFTLCTVTMEEPALAAAALMELRMQLAWDGLHLDGVFHATEDPQEIRDRVFRVLDQLDFRIDATIFEKSKARPHLQSEGQLYKHAWFYHLKHVAQSVAIRSDRMFVAAASIGTKKKRKDFHRSVKDVVDQVSPCDSYRVAFWPNASHSCLQVADYCTWAIQRKWEREDERSHILIAQKIKSEYPIWDQGQTHYY